MIAEAVNYYEIVAKLPADTVVTFYNVTWDDYEELLEQVGEASGLRISYNDGTLKVMSLSVTHELYVRFIERLMALIDDRLGIRIISIGSATMRKRKKAKGNEADGGFYIQSADLIGRPFDLDFAVDLPPDVIVEVDVHHRSKDNDPIYAALGVPEIWRYDERKLTILYLRHDEYVQSENSLALPMVTAAILTECLTRLHQEDDRAALRYFKEWLQSLQAQA